MRFRNQHALDANVKTIITQRGEGNDEKMTRLEVYYELWTEENYGKSQGNWSPDRDLN